MKMLQLGDSPVSVPPLAIGTMFWGTRVSRPRAHDLLDHALQAGACFVDTANNYAFWESAAWVVSQRPAWASGSPHAARPLATGSSWPPRSVLAPPRLAQAPRTLSA